jgi:hypothetical protein
MTDQKERDILLFLGSGATAGSGITKYGKSLPADGNFFKNIIIKDILNKTVYPALSLARDKILNNKRFENDLCSLYKTWNHFFVLRGLAVSKIFRFDTDLRDEFHDLSKHRWPDSHRFQRLHYKCEFATMGHSRLPDEYHFLELAIWDLRALVHEVYDNSCMCYDNNALKTTWNKFNDKLQAVINLNYDTTFDDSLDKGRDFYYPGEFSCAKKTYGDEQNSIPIIRPHGSLGWTSIGKRPVSTLDWKWREEWEKTALNSLGYEPVNDNPFQLNLRQSLIVTPVFVKEEIVGNSSMPGLGNPILKSQWTSLESALRKSAELGSQSHWVFLGLSLQSGDEYLLTLLKLHHSGQKVHFSNFERRCDDLKSFVYIFGEDNICEHLYCEGNIDEFFSQAPKGCDLG